MRKNSTFGLIWVMIGTFIGAGFASGKEIATYFSRFGFFSLVLALIAGVLFYIFMKACLMIGKKIGAVGGVYKTCFGKFGGLIRATIIIATFVTVGSMLAGAYEIFGIFFSRVVNIILLVILMLIVGLVVIKNYQMITKVNTLLIPALLGAILIVCIVFVLSGNYGVVIQKMSLFQGFSSLLSYVSFNMLSTGVFLIEVGAKYDEKQINTASLISSGLITFFIMLAGVSLYLGGEEIMGNSLPLVETACNLSQALGVVMIGVVFIGLTTSLISDVYVLSIYAKNLNKNRYLVVGIILLLGFLISLLGFSFIVINLYALLGGLGVLFLIAILICYTKFKREKSNKKTL